MLWHHKLLRDFYELVADKSCRIASDEDWPLRRLSGCCYSQLCRVASRYCFNAAAASGGDAMMTMMSDMRFGHVTALHICCRSSRITLAIQSYSKTARPR